MIGISLPLSAAYSLDLLKEKVEEKTRFWSTGAAKKARRPLTLYKLPDISVSADIDLEVIKDMVERVFLADAFGCCGFFDPRIRFDGFELSVSYKMSKKKFKREYRKPLEDVLKKCFISVCAQFVRYELEMKPVRMHPRASEKLEYKELWIKIDQPSLVA